MSLLVLGNSKRWKSGQLLGRASLTAKDQRAKDVLIAQIFSPTSVSGMRLVLFIMRTALAGEVAQ